MDRLASLRGVPSRAEDRHPSGYGPPRAGEWPWDEDVAPARERSRLPWSRAALIIGVLSLALWALVFLVIGMLFR